MLHSVLVRVSSLCRRGVVANPIVPIVVSASGAKTAYLLTVINASMIHQVEGSNPRPSFRRVLSLPLGQGNRHK